MKHSGAWCSAQLRAGFDMISKGPHIVQAWREDWNGKFRFNFLQGVEMAKRARTRLAEIKSKETHKVNS